MFEMPPSPEAETARLVEPILVALMQLTDRNGLKIRLGTDQQVEILTAAIYAVNNMRGDAGALASRFGS
jgi:hypothetical protein